MWERWGDRIEFIVVYIREAHPEEGWVVNPNRAADILINDPETNEERVEVAASGAVNLQIRMPVVVDDVDDAIASAYGALPDRLYLIDRDAIVTFQGDPGPWGFDPAALEKAIEATLDRKRPQP